MILTNSPPSPARTESRSAIQREGPPRRFNEFVQVFAVEQTNTPVSSIYVCGQMSGEVSVSPEALYWSVPNATNAPSERPEALVLRRGAGGGGCGGGGGWLSRGGRKSRLT